jgi:hypothetical protein
MLIRMKTMLTRLSAAGIALVVTLWPAIVWAQQAAPQPTLRKSPAPWLGMLVMFLLLAIVLGISLMPSKRGHQD